MKTSIAMLALCVSSSALAQQSTWTNSIGMEFVRIDPGEFVVGRFEPPYVQPPAAAAAPAVNVNASDLAPLLMAKGDMDGDGALDRAEWTTMVWTLYEALDAGRAGRLIRPVLAAGWPRVLGAPGFGSPGFGEPRNVAARNTAPGVFRLADRDGDDYIDAAEWTTLFNGWFVAWADGQPATVNAAGLAAGLLATIPYPAAPLAITADEYRRIEGDARAAWREGFTVRLQQPYYIGRFEVTQGQWERVMGSNPSTFTAALLGSDAARHPVESVTWQQAQEFVARLNALEGTDAYRLPSEFEWEYAARAGRRDEIAWSETRRQAYTGIGGNRSTRPVGSMEPNAWGLHDTLGNVWEWVADYYNGKLFADPVPPATGTTHVLKGAGFVADVKNATYTTHAAGPGNGFDVGFRLARRIDP